MASCLVPDFTAVFVALEHLADLDKQLKEGGVPFSPEASQHLQEITVAITELEASTRAVHEQLEIETIENSKLRHRVHNIQDQITQDITADVAAARECNAEEMAQLHKDLSTISQRQEVMFKRQEALYRQNAALYPERDHLKAEHNNVIATLNNQIIKKNSRQTQLSQTLDQLNKLKTCIGTLELNKIKLQQDIVLEGETFAMSKEALLREVNQTIENIQEQKKENARKTRELDIAINQQVDNDNCLTELTNHVAQVECGIRRRTASQSHCEKQLAEETQQHQDLTLQRETLENNLCELRESFNNNTQRLQEDIIMVDREIEKGQAVTSVYLDSLGKVSESFKRQRKEEDEAKADHLNVLRRLERSRLRMDERKASIAKHLIQIGEMEEVTTQLLEANIINKGVFQKNLEELHDKLDIERKNTGLFEEENQRLSRSLEEVKRQQEKNVARLSSDITTTSMRYQELRQEGVTLQQHQSMSCAIDSLTSQVIQTELDYNHMVNTCHQKIDRYTAVSEHVHRSREDKMRDVEEKEQVLKEVEAQFEEEESTHNKLEKLTSEFQNSRQQLVLSTQRLKENTICLLQPKEHMKVELNAMRAYHMSLLAQQASALSAVELSIYDSGLKLEQVDIENSRLRLCIAQMKEDIGNARKDKSRHSQEICRLREKVNVLFDGLPEAWKEDFFVTEECQGSDRGVLESLGRLLEKVQSRRLRLGHINAQLHQYLLFIRSLLANKKHSK